MNLAIMCTDKEVAWQSTIDRYNAMEARGLFPRAVPRDKYDATVDALPDNVSELYKSGKFDDIFLFNRNRECLYRLTEQPNLNPAEIVKRELNRQPIINITSKPTKSIKSLSEKMADAKRKCREQNTANPRPDSPNQTRHKR